MTITKVDNGYIVINGAVIRVYTELDAVFRDMLLCFEGRGIYFGGNSYGRVIVDRTEPVKP